MTMRITYNAEQDKEEKYKYERDKRVYERVTKKMRREKGKMIGV